MKIVQNSLKSYFVFDINLLKKSECLVFNLYIKRKNNYTIIIEAGTVLSENIYHKLTNQDKLYIQKEDFGKDKLTCLNLKNHIFYNVNNIKRSFDLLNSINNKIFSNYLNSKDNIISLECVENLIKSIIFLIKNNQLFFKALISEFLNEHELASHSFNVCVYSIGLGNALEFNDEDLLRLGIAGLLHDIGIKNIDAMIINSSEKLSLSELESIQKHPLHSVQIIKNNHILDPYIIDAITHHHENYDGSGYPDALMGSDISCFASIVSIADVFDALTNKRPNREAYKSFDALKLMIKDEMMVNRFNYKYLKRFLTLL